MDNICYNLLSQLALPNIRLISLNEFEKDDARLVEAKKDRTLIEYYFTCTPSLPLYILNSNEDIDLITYLDADIYFFNPVEPIFQEMGNKSILIIGHRFSEKFKHLEKFGKYNVEFITFKRDKNAIDCLLWWRDRCIEWCHDRVDKGRFADQKYLDEFPKLFGDVHILKHKGAGLAPWNISNYRLNVGSNGLIVDENMLIFYHFHNLKKLSNNIYSTGLSSYGAKVNKTIRNNIYHSYICELKTAQSQIQKKGMLIDQSSMRRERKRFESIFIFILFLKSLRKGEIIYSRNNIYR
jgi:hypothetical protein